MKQLDRFADWCTRLEWCDVKPWVFGALAIVVALLAPWVLGGLKSPGTGLPGALPGLSLP